MENGADESGGELKYTSEYPVTQPAELFRLSELTKYWNPDWKLEGAGFGGAGGGMRGIRALPISIATYWQLTRSGSKRREIEP